MVARVSIKSVTPKQLYLNRLPPVTRRAFLLCITLPLFTKLPWYLAGGTALALQVGHRQSKDLDFFIPRTSFSENLAERALFATGKWKTSYRENGTIYGELQDGKVSLIAYPFFIPSLHQVKCGTVRMLTPSDIAAMKIVAISQRGRKRDFVDLFWYVQHRESLTVIIRRAVRQYPGQENNLPHILKSLTYFDDAENDPMPTLYFKVNWCTVKKYFQREVPKVAKELLFRA